MSKTGELSRLFEIDRTTLNYYVKTGLLQPDSEKNQYHNYSFSDSIALAFIRYYRGLGFRKEEIVQLLCHDDNQQKLANIRQKQKELEEQIRMEQLKLLLLMNLQECMQFIAEKSFAPYRLVTEPYYFVHKEDILQDPFWMELYKTVPSIEFSASYDRKQKKVAFRDLFSNAGLSMKASWLEEYGLQPPSNSVYYPSEEEYVMSFRVSGKNMEEEISSYISDFFSTPPWNDLLKEDFVFYLFPARYMSDGGSFDCLCFFRIHAIALD